MHLFMGRTWQIIVVLVILFSLASYPVESNEFTCNQTLVTQATHSFWNKYWNSLLQYLNDYYIEVNSQPHSSAISSPTDKNDPILLTAYWTYAMALDTIIDAWEREQALFSPPPLQNNYTSLIDKMIKGQSIRLEKWISGYVDDMNWMALALVRVLRNKIPLQTYSTSQLEALVQNMYQNYIANQWDTTCCGNVKGGIWWDREKKTQKATASNAGPVILAATLFEYFQSVNQTEPLQNLKTFALQVYSFWYTTMVNPQTNQVYDHIEASTGQRVNWKFSYNEGLMVGAGVSLYRITKDVTFLNHAITFAKFIMSSEIAIDRAGNAIIEDAAPCAGDCMEFKGIAMRYLNNLYKELKLIPNHPFTSPLKVFLQNNIVAIQSFAYISNYQMFSVSWLGSNSTTLKYFQSQNNCALMSLLLLCR